MRPELLLCLQRAQRCVNRLVQLYAPRRLKIAIRHECRAGQSQASLTRPEAWQRKTCTIRLSSWGEKVEVIPQMSWDPVYRLVKQIPRGRVTTYGHLANALRLRGGARAVGYAMAACPSGHGIPWHRVVGAGGRLLMPEPHASLQRRLLESEGTQIRGSRVDFQRHAWDPKKSRARKSAPRSRVRR